jgi:hypothetical protein
LIEKTGGNQPGSKGFQQHAMTTIALLTARVNVLGLALGCLEGIARLRGDIRQASPSRYSMNK